MKAAKVPAGMLDTLTFTDFADFAYRSSSRQPPKEVVFGLLTLKHAHLHSALG